MYHPRHRGPPVREQAQEMAAEPFDAGLELPLAGEASLEEIGNRTVQVRE